MKEVGSIRGVGYANLVSQGCLTSKDEARKYLKDMSQKYEHKKPLPIILAHLSINKSVRNILASLQ